jgi:hypothetical protein
MTVHPLHAVPPPVFRRELPLGVVVRLDGRYDDAGQPNSPMEDPGHAVGRVVLELPDFIADSLAHMIETHWELAKHLTGDGPTHAPDQDVAAALLAAVLSVPGYHCPIRTPKLRTAGHDQAEKPQP